MRDKVIAHIGIGYGKGETKAVDAVKMAVESPLLETTVNGATDVIINISGDISLTDASEAVGYVQDQAGEDVNIIFGAMYDESQQDSCNVTVIATGIGSKEETNVPIYGRQASSSVYGSTLNSYKSQVQRGGGNTGTSNVRQQSLEIPSFLKNSGRR
jgi:cell division protein FtsZ